MATEPGRAPTEALRAFLLEGVRDTGKTVGNGSYATVKELDFRGLKCVGKKIHDTLYDLASPQERVGMLERFASECQLLSRLHHPCIVQFLGVYLQRDSQLPVMVMEYLHTTLSACLDQGVLPEEISYEILLDVIVGLSYIHEHSPPIIHRDLSANNVLLTPNMNAKISDLGMAKILNINPVRLGLMTQTQTPGTPCYMPPEAMVARPKYTNKVDIFSFGVMMVHMLSGEWPIPGEAFREDPNNPDSNIPLSEFERRAEYLQRIRQDHPLMRLIRQCLNNVQSRRPEAAAIHERIKTIVAGLPPSFVNRSEMLHRINSLSGQVETLTQEVERLSVGRGDSVAQQSSRAYSNPMEGAASSQVHRGVSYGSGSSSHIRPKGPESQCDERTVILLGKVGSGKKTIGNRIAGQVIFRGESTLSSTTRVAGSSYGQATVKGIRYRIQTIDTESSQLGYSNPIPQIMEKFETVNLILFVIANGRYTDESHASMTHAVKSLSHRATRISALVITNCEGLSKEMRAGIVGEFRADERSSRVAAFMEKGMYTVGFPETYLPQLKEVMEKGMDEDADTLCRLAKCSKDAIPIANLPGEFETTEPFARFSGHHVPESAYPRRGSRGKQQYHGQPRMPIGDCLLM